MSDEAFDIVILGAGPAGSTAANLLARAGRTVALIDGDTFPRDRVCAGWLGARALPLLAELGVSLTPPRAYACDDVTFHKADFSESTKPNFEAPPVYLIDRARFDDTLVKAARKSGASLVLGSAATDVALKESSVEVSLADGNKIEGKLLLLAAGRGSQFVERVGVSLGSAGDAFWSAQVSVNSGKGASPSSPKVAVVLGLDKAGSFGLCCSSKHQVSVGVYWMGEKREAVAALIDLCRSAYARKLVPVDLSDAAPAATCSRALAGAAIEMDTHVGKHTLVIGEAGGFTSAASHEGIYPSMWSAQIAAEVAIESLQSIHSQDALMSFNSVWRIRMAEYLRSPHTDIQFLLPLIFSNQPMADRMGAAFFLGENI